jgi:hypothetical protein
VVVTFICQILSHLHQPSQPSSCPLVVEGGSFVHTLAYLHTEQRGNDPLNLKRLSILYSNDNKLQTTSQVTNTQQSLSTLLACPQEDIVFSPKWATDNPLGTRRETTKSGSNHTLRRCHPHILTQARTEHSVSETASRGDPISSTPPSTCLYPRFVVHSTRTRWPSSTGLSDIIRSGAALRKLSPPPFVWILSFLWSLLQRNFSSKCIRHPLRSC